MAEESISEILAGLDPNSITVDSSGRVGSNDPIVAAKLNILRERLRVGSEQARLAQLQDPVNVAQCYCGGGSQGSACAV